MTGSRWLLYAEKCRAKFPEAIGRGDDLRTVGDLLLGSCASALVMERVVVDIACDPVREPFGPSMPTSRP